MKTGDIGNQGDLGREIQKRRKELGMTGEQLAERIGVNPNTVRRWETGERIPNVLMIMDLSSILRCLVLITGDVIVLFPNRISQ